MNKDDSERIARRLVLDGHVPVSDPDQASIVILNGCSVRDNSDRKVWGRISALGSRKQKRGNLLIALTGCSAAAPQEEIAPHLKWLDVVFPARDIRPLCTLLEETPGPVTDDLEDLIPEELPGTGAVSRYVTAIHGCDKRCTFCIVPFRRGPEESRSIEEIISEIESRVDEGAREIILLGQIINRYGRTLSPPTTLSTLLETVDSSQLVPRLRFLTAHPRHMDRDLATAMGRLSSVCEEINLPVQSGDDLVLKRMGRGYNTDFYREQIHHLRTEVPNVAISTDIIVGFPGETDAQFQNTLQLLEEIRFDVVHVAAFSARIGTVAEQWGDTVDQDEKMQRLHQVEDLQKEIATSINNGLLGTVQEVLFEELRENPIVGASPRWMGRTRTNKLVFCEPNSKIKAGDIRQIEITKTTAWSLRGRAVSTLTPQSQSETAY
jgi:tRNA-2-methylthio-N6-dimethylallyladenosine synthase